MARIFNSHVAFKCPILKQTKLAGPFFYRFFRAGNRGRYPDRFFWISDQSVHALFLPQQHSERHVSATWIIEPPGVAHAHRNVIGCEEVVVWTIRVKERIATVGE